jgi:hypothetical protein
MDRIVAIMPDLALAEGKLSYFEDAAGHAAAGLAATITVMFQDISPLFPSYRICLKNSKYML